MANRIWKEYDFLIFHSKIIHCGLLQSSAVVDLLPHRWFHYPEIIVITIKSPFINCHINYPPCCLLIWNLLSSWSPGAHFIPSTNPVSSLESCKRWTWLLWHTNVLSVLLWRCLLIVQSSDRFGNASVYSSCDSWFCWYWLAICQDYFYFPLSPLWFPHFFWFWFFFGPQFPPACSTFVFLPLLQASSAWIPALLYRLELWYHLFCVSVMPPASPTDQVYIQY